MGMYTEEDLARWTREAMDKHINVKEVNLLPLNEVGVNVAWTLESLMDRQEEVVEKFCNDNNVVLIYITQNCVTIIPDKYLKVSEFTLYIPKSHEYEVRHVIGSGGRNIKEFMNNVNYLKETMHNSFHGFYGTKWIRDLWFGKDQTPYNKNTLRRVNVKVKES